jgi:hypothetical protein
MSTLRDEDIETNGGLTPTSEMETDVDADDADSDDSDDSDHADAMDDADADDPDSGPQDAGA